MAGPLLGQLVILATAALPSTAQVMIAPGLEAPPKLPSPPWLPHYLFENPFPAAVALLAVALILAAFGSRRLSRRAVVAGVLAAVALAIGVLVAAWQVTTPRERIEQRARELVAAVASASPERAGPILAEDAVLYAMFTGPGGLDKPNILHQIQTDMAGAYLLHDHRVREVDVLLEGPKVARSHVLVMVDPEQTRVQTWSWWRIDWVLEGADWRVHAIEPISIQGVERPGRR